MTTPKTVPVAALIRELRKQEKLYRSVGSHITANAYSDTTYIIRSVAARAGRKKGKRS